MPRSHSASDGRDTAVPRCSSLEPGSPARADRVSYFRDETPPLALLGRAPRVRLLAPIPRLTKAAEVGPLRPTGPRLRSTSAEPGRRPLPVVVEIFRPRSTPIARRGPLARVSRFGSQRVALHRSETSRRFECVTGSRPECQRRERQRRRADEVRRGGLEAAALSTSAIRLPSDGPFQRPSKLTP